MAGIPVTKSRYEKFVNAFLLEGRTFGKVAIIMGCSEGTARNAWDYGWPAHKWARPIKVVFEEQAKKARNQAKNPAAVEREKPVGPIFEDAEVEAAVNPDEPNLINPPQTVELIRVMGESDVDRLLDSAVMQVKANVATALIAEQEMIAVARNNLTGVLLLSDKLLTGLQPLVATVVERLRAMASDASVNPTKILSYIDRVIKINIGAVNAGARLLEMQRLLVGMPQSITESRSVDTPKHTLNTDADAARAELEQVLADVERRTLAAISSGEDLAGEANLPDEPDDTDTDE